MTTDGTPDTATHHCYVCTSCGRDVRMVAEIVPDGWDSYKNNGRKFACNCTTLEEGEVDRPSSWVIETDHEFGP